MGPEWAVPSARALIRQSINQMALGYVKRLKQPIVKGALPV